MPCVKYGILYKSITVFGLCGARTLLRCARMCYSAGVSVAAGTVIAAGASLSWWQAAATGLLQRGKELRGFVLFAVAGFASIGVHQFAEAYSVTTGSQLVYKLGLIASIACMYFYMRSLESITKKRWGSDVFLAVIVAVGIDIARRPMIFENAHFWLRGYSHFLWAASWIALFLYWNACVFHVARQSGSSSHRRMLSMYAFCILNASFLLSVVYAYLAAYVQRTGVSIPLFSVQMMDAMRAVRVI